MIGQQYPISRSDILELDFLKKIVLSLSQGGGEGVEKAIDAIGESINKNAIRLNLSCDIANLCEFSLRIGREALTDDIRVRLYGDNLWIIGPRDGKILTFIEGGNRLEEAKSIAREARNAAIALYFSIALKSDKKFCAGANSLAKFIEDNNLWSFKETEHIRNSEMGAPFNFTEYMKRSEK